MPALNFRFVVEEDSSGLFIQWYEVGGPTHVGLLFPGGVLSGDQRADLTREYEFGARIGVDKALSGKPGVQFRPADYATFARTEVIVLPVTGAEYSAVWAGMHRALGAGYSVREILAFVAGRELGHAHHSFICSVVIVWLLGLAGIAPLEVRGHEHEFTPAACRWLILGVKRGRELVG